MIGPSPTELSQVLFVQKIRTHTRGTAEFNKEGHLVRLDQPAEGKITDNDVCILLRIPEQHIFWLEVAVDDAKFVKVCNCAKDGPNDICSFPVIQECKVMDGSRKM